MHPDYAMHDVLSFEVNGARGHCLESCMVGRSNEMMKAVSQALVVHDKETWTESLPYVLMAYIATPHGFTPHKMFNSQCADPLLSIDRA
jgi:hypothetical protein